jgi:hypothetical protein
MIGRPLRRSTCASPSGICSYEISILVGLEQWVFGMLLPFATYGQSLYSTRKDELISLDVVLF